MMARRFYLHVFSVCLLASAAAPASPVPMASLSPAAARNIDAFTAKARAANPQIFRSVSKLREELPGLARKARGGKVNVRARLVALGPEALPAVLSELKDGAAPAVGDLLASTNTSWVIGLLETAGHWSNPIAVPVLESVATQPDGSAPVIAAAIRALGELGTMGSEDAEKRLEEIYGRRAGAMPELIESFGYCRRITMARFLLGTLESASNGQGEAQRNGLVKALGQVASGWVWETANLAKTGEGNDLRRAVFDALVQRYSHADAAARRVLTDALWLVDLPDGAARVKAHGAKNGTDEAALTELASKLASSPLRR